MTCSAVATVPDPWDHSRGLFYLFAAVVLGSVVLTLAAGGTCMIAVLAGIDPGTRCDNLGLKDFMIELVATVMVLLNARPPAPPK